MPLLDRTGFIPDPFAPEAGDARLVAWADLAEAFATRASNQRIGVIVPNDLGADALAPHLAALDLVAIVFPAFSDGRGFSLARQLRQRGFTARLRAVGPLIADQFAYALACGFDEIDLPEAVAARQPEAQWRAALDAFSGHYQRSYGAGASILDRRRAARETDRG